MDEDILDEDLDNIIDIYWHESAFYIIQIYLKQTMGYI